MVSVNNWNCRYGISGYLYLLQISVNHSFFFPFPDLFILICYNCLYSNTQIVVVSLSLSLSLREQMDTDNAQSFYLLCLHFNHDTSIGRSGMPKANSGCNPITLSCSVSCADCNGADS